MYCAASTLFFNTTHQVKAIAIAIVEANPLVEIVSVLLFSSLHTCGTYVTANYIKRGMHPYSIPFIAIKKKYKKIIVYSL